MEDQNFLERWLRSHQFLRFVIVGICNTVFGYSIYASLLYFGVGYRGASFVSIFCGVLFSYRTQGRFVFGGRARQAFWRFVLAWAAIYLGNIAFIGLLMAEGLGAYISGILVLPLTTVASFLMQKHYVFRNEQTPSQDKR